MEPFNWVSEGSLHKFHRAVEALRKAGKEINEENIRELYVKYGGRIIAEDEVQEVLVAPSVVRPVPVSRKRK